MKKLFKLLLAVGSTLLSLSTAYASHSQPTTFIGPTVRGGYTGLFADMGAYSIAGEAGPRNYRAGTTLGLKINPNQRFKITGEYLWQKINYSFYTGDTKQWVQQGAIGARYEFDFFDILMSPQIDINAYYSHAKSKNLNPIVQTSVISAVIDGSTFTTIQTLTNNRRIAGSDAGGISPGFSLLVWPGGRVGVEANYDHVDYHKHYAPWKKAKGWGVTGYFKEIFMDNIVLGVSAADRRPFNDYEGNIGFTNLNWNGNWTLGLYGNYLEGKKTLPNTWNIGLSVDYLMEPCALPSLKGEVPVVAHDPFLAWVADPAIHMPQVLAIPDESVDITTTTLINLCSPAILVGTLPDFAFDPGPDGTPAPIPPVNAAAAFSGSAPITYTMTYFITSQDPDSAADLTINAATGQITGTVTAPNNNPFTVTVTVTATNACGSASTSFDISVSVD